MPNIKFIFRRLPEIVIYYLSRKNYYLCDGCNKIHNRLENDIDLNSKYGLFVSQACVEKSRKQAMDILKNAMLSK